jgi:2-keto-3-deoxy-L-fuconate dehydrogenase
LNGIRNKVLMADFDGLVTVVTGASSGIGLATATELRHLGAQVAVIDREPFPGSGEVLSLIGDVTDQDSVDEAVRSVLSAFGRLDVVVNNAGIAAVGSVVDNTDQEWRSVFDVNVLGIVRMMRACLPELRRSPHGAVVNVSSVAATAGLVQRACYSASKGAVLSLTLAMSADLLADRVRVNCVTPGTIDTPWIGRLLSAAEDADQERAALEQRQPMGRLGLAEEVASAVAFLASPQSSFITGIALPVDGGMAGVRPPRGQAAQPLGTRS